MLKQTFTVFVNLESVVSILSIFCQLLKVQLCMQCIFVRFCLFFPILSIFTICMIFVYFCHFLSISINFVYFYRFCRFLLIFVDFRRFSSIFVGFFSSINRRFLSVKKRFFSIMSILSNVKFRIRSINPSNFETFCYSHL